MNKNLTITIVGVAIASIGLIFVLTSPQGTTDWDKTKVKVTELCEPTYMEDGFDSLGDCVMHYLVRFEQVAFGPDPHHDFIYKPKLTRQYGLAFEAIDKDCSENYLEYNFTSIQECEDTKKNLVSPFDFIKYTECQDEIDEYMIPQGIICIGNFQNLGFESYPQCIQKAFQLFESTGACLLDNDQ